MIENGSGKMERIARRKEVLLMMQSIVVRYDLLMLCLSGKWRVFGLRENTIEDREQRVERGQGDENINNSSGSRNSSDGEE